MTAPRKTSLRFPPLIAALNAPDHTAMEHAFAWAGTDDDKEDCCHHDAHHRPPVFFYPAADLMEDVAEYGAQLGIVDAAVHVDQAAVVELLVACVAAAGC